MQTQRIDRRRLRTVWAKRLGENLPRPRCRWQRWRLLRPTVAIPCELCGERRTTHYGSGRALEAHQWRDHRGVYLRRELLRIEQAVRWRHKHRPYAVEDDRSWAHHPEARRYRRLMRAWWALGRVEYSAAMDWTPNEGLPKQGPLTRLGEPSTGASGVSWTWYTQPWLKAVATHWPEKWPLVHAEMQRRAAYK